MVLGKKVAIIDLEWGRNLAPRAGQKMPCLLTCLEYPFPCKHYKHKCSCLIPFGYSKADT